MNFSKDNIRIIHVQKKHKCTMCDFRTHKKYNLNVHLKGIHGISNIKEQSTQIQNGLGTTYIPIEKYKEVCNATDQWKICYEKLQKEHTLLQEHRREGTTHIPIEKHNEVVGIAHGWKKECEKMQEAYQLLGEETNAIISYLETVLNANNIRYNLELA